MTAAAAWPRVRTALHVLVVAVGVAVAAGLSAAVLKWLLDAATKLILERLVALPMSASAWAGPIPRGSGWLLPAVVAAGLLATAWVGRIGRGTVNGTDGVIAAVNSRDLTGLDTRGGTTKLVSTVLTLGTGGSAGTEGPVAQIAASAGAVVTRWARLPEYWAAVLVGCAMGSGVAALFQTPVGGALFAAEILRRRGLSPRMILPAAVCAPIAFAVFVAIHGRHPMFGTVALGPLFDPVITGLLAAVGLACAVVACVYVAALRTGSAVRAARPGRMVLVALSAGAVVGLVGLVVPASLSTGYSAAGATMTAAVVLAAPLWMLALAPVAKIVTTAVTLNTGGSGGVFGPAMVAGAFTGALAWRLANEAGLPVGAPAVFVVAGLAACVGAAARVPLTAIALATESVGATVPPAGLVLAVVVATLVTRSVMLFPSQADGCERTRPPHQPISVLWKRKSGKGDPGGMRESGFSGRSGAGVSTAIGCAHRTESPTVGQVTDLSAVDLEELAPPDDPVMTALIDRAVERRAAAGIVFAGHNSNSGA
ncbi:chloride channel protein [Nocardia sp. IBHARD005]|uniref:chloride channel protein n=1 Tax=Nocardia sp. IBHARD005 TaxID=3457765 RepID=UPI0040593E46